MKKLPAIAIGAAAAALAGTATAATPKTHRMDVPMPDGSVAHVDYVGDVAPKVTIAPPAVVDATVPWAVGFPLFAGFDRMIEQMNRRSQEMMRQAQQMSHAAPGAAPYIASYGNLPAGQTSTTVVSFSNGGQTCTRTTEVVAQGAGKPPKITSEVSGQCSDPPAAPRGPTHPV